jgi:hypothetical protein
MDQDEISLLQAEKKLNSDYNTILSTEINNFKYYNLIQ